MLERRCANSQLGCKIFPYSTRQIDIVIALILFTLRKHLGTTNKLRLSIHCPSKSPNDSHTLSLKHKMISMYRQIAQVTFAESGCGVVDSVKGWQRAND